MKGVKNVPTLGCIAGSAEVTADLEFNDASTEDVLNEEIPPCATDIKRLNKCGTFRNDLK